MSFVFFDLFHTSTLSKAIVKEGGEIGDFEMRQFPDQETYLRIDSDINNRDVIIYASLNNPNTKILPLLFFVETARDMGAKHIGLIAPYLCYMRQDKRFNPGEGITSNYFARLISHYFNWLITIDSHLHRYHSLGEIYAIPAFELHAHEKIALWIKANVINPVLIGPDGESKTMVSTIAKQVNCPYLVLEKERKGDHEVVVTAPQLQAYKNHIPVLVDDIISSGTTLLAAIAHLKTLNMKPSICIGVHAIFAGNAYETLLQSGADKIITCNTIPHPSNGIDINDILISAIREK